MAARLNDKRSDRRRHRVKAAGGCHSKRRATATFRRQPAQVLDRINTVMISDSVKIAS